MRVLMDIPILAMSEVPYVTTKQMIEVDRAMMEDYQVESRSHFFTK
jgi:hypothetical protein